MSYRGRDVEVVPIGPDQYLVAACDSCGAVGLKELDLVKVPPYITGRLTTRVALLELIAVGGQPQLATVTIANEPEPTGTGILSGVRDELAACGWAALPLGISTEKNFSTRQTALGVSVVGLCGRQDLRVATTRPGDLLYCLGLPRLGPEVPGPDDPQLVQGCHVRELLQFPAVHDIVPVGSQGIAGEAERLVAGVACRWSPDLSAGIDLAESAGPSTCLIFSSSEPFDALSNASISCRCIGTIEALS